MTYTRLTESTYFSIWGWVIEVKNCQKMPPSVSLLVTAALNYLITPVISYIFQNFPTVSPAPSWKAAACKISGRCITNFWNFCYLKCTFASGIYPSPYSKYYCIQYYTTVVHDLWVKILAETFPRLRRGNSLLRLIKGKPTILKDPQLNKIVVF